MPSKMLLQISNLNNISTETNNTIFEVKVYSQNEYNSELILIILKFPNFALPMRMDVLAVMEQLKFYSCVAYRQWYENIIMLLCLESQL